MTNNKFTVISADLTNGSRIHIYMERLLDIEEVDRNIRQIANNHDVVPGSFKVEEKER